MGRQAAASPADHSPGLRITSQPIPDPYPFKKMKRTRHAPTDIREHASPPRSSRAPR
jgi:hypothetical protein